MDEKPMESMLAETAANSNHLESGVTFEAVKTRIWLAPFFS
jgi:hypothetical protein